MPPMSSSAARTLTIIPNAVVPRTQYPTWSALLQHLMKAIGRWQRYRQRQALERSANAIKAQRLIY